MVLKIEANKLREFIVKTTADGLVKDCYLDFKEDGLHMSHKDEQGVVLIVGVLDKSNFKGYDPVNLVIKDSNVFIKSLKTFGDNLLNIVKKDNMVRIFDENGGFDLALAESVDCHFDKPVPGLEYNNTILVKKSMVTGIVERSSIVKSESILVQNVGKELIFQIGEETDHADVRMPTSVEQDVTTSFDLEYFKNLTKNFDTVFDLSIGFDGVPSKFVEKNDKYSIIYFLTPVGEISAPTAESEKKEEAEKPEAQ